MNELQDVSPGPPEQPYIILQGRLDAATVDEAWSGAVRIRDAAAREAWAALHTQRASTDRRPFSWYGAGVEVYALRAQDETDTTFIQRARARPTRTALPADPST
jgi:hypothetical protein